MCNQGESQLGNSSVYNNYNNNKNKKIDNSIYNFMSNLF